MIKIDEKLFENNSMATHILYNYFCLRLLQIIKWLLSVLSVHAIEANILF